MKPQILDLVFYLGKNEKTGAPQWKSDTTSGCMEIVYVPDAYSTLKPSATQKHFKCYRGRTVFQNHSGTFMIVAVDLFEAVVDQIVELELVDIEVDMSKIEYDLELEFKRGVHSGTKEKQWQSSVYDKENDYTTLHIVDRNSPMLPTMNGDKFACIEKCEIYRNDEDGFAIVAVIPVAKLDPDTLLMTWSDAIRTVRRSPIPSMTSIIGTISRVKHGRSAGKRLADAEKRHKMKGAKLQDDSKGHNNKKRKSA